MQELKPIPFLLQPNISIPNNPLLPLLHYRQVFEGDSGKLENQFKKSFEQNNWGGTWLNGIFGYHHYHSTSHEALGVVSGTATVIFGGPGGEEVEVLAGDMVVLPAGTGHCLQKSSDDFKVIGAYPKGQEEYDICTEADDVAVMQRCIRQVLLPTADPVGGKNGPLMEQWAGTA